MFSFRTTPIGEQLDRALLDGKVGVFCTHNAWDPVSGQYLYDFFKKRGNLTAIFLPRESELSPEESHIEFDIDEMKGLNALVVEIQDVGSRYFSHTVDVLRLMSSLRLLGEDAPSLYVVDHFNPAGRTVEGTIPSVSRDVWTPLAAHRHGLTLGELCHLYHNEIDARYPLHIISAAASAYGKLLMPWSIAPSSDITGMFSALMYSGGALWKGSSITPGIGTPRPFEYIGAPFLKPGETSSLPVPEGVVMRWCSFVPSFGKYEGEKCYGYQIIVTPGAEYHSLLHTLRLMKFFQQRYSRFTLSEEFYAMVSDPVIESFFRDDLSFDIVQEHIKTEEQKWIRKAKRFVLYDDMPCRIK